MEGSGLLHLTVNEKEITQNDEKYSVWYYLSTLLKDLALLLKQTEDLWICLGKDIILGGLLLVVTCI